MKPGYYWARIEKDSDWEPVRIGDEFEVWSLGTAVYRPIDSVFEWGDKIGLKFGLKYVPIGLKLGLKYVPTWDPKVFEIGSCWRLRGGVFGNKGVNGLIENIKDSGRTLSFRSSTEVTEIQVASIDEISFARLVEVT